jgi:transcriptional regulator with XRE-family HTH domain
MIDELIESPFSAGKANLLKKLNVLTFRKNEFEITEHFYVCENTNEEFTTSELDEININQVYNQYRDKFGLPFPDQIKRIREKYDVSAIKMSEILGLGANSYRLYEQGEVPSVGNGRQILSAEDPETFKRYLISNQELIDPKEFQKLINRVDELIDLERINNYYNHDLKELFGKIASDQYTGYKMPSIEKISHMVLFFSENAETWKTKLNKLLFYTDFLAFKNSGFGISGLDYRAIQYGPVPSKYGKLYDEISKGECLKRVCVEERDYEGSFFIPKLTFNENLFDEFELEIMKMVSDKFKWHSANEIKEVSHEELAWKENKEEQKIISYKDYGFTLQTI